MKAYVKSEQTSQNGKNDTQTTHKGQVFRVFSEPKSKDTNSPIRKQAKA